LNCSKWFQVYKLWFHTFLLRDRGGNYNQGPLGSASSHPDRFLHPFGISEDRDSPAGTTHEHKRGLYQSIASRWYKVRRVRHSKRPHTLYFGTQSSDKGILWRIAPEKHKTWRTMSYAVYIFPRKQRRKRCAYLGALKGTCTFSCDKIVLLFG